MGALVPPIIAPPLIPGLPSIPNPLAPNPFNLGALGNHVPANPAIATGAAASGSGLSLSAPVASNPVGATVGLGFAALGVGLIGGNAAYEAAGRPFGPSLGDRAWPLLFGDPATGAVPDFAGPGDTDVQPSAAAFTGGQSSGVPYLFDVYSVQDGVAHTPREWSKLGPIGIKYDYIYYDDGSSRVWGYITHGQGQNIHSGHHEIDAYELVISNVRRADGQPDVGGNPPAPPISTPWPTPSIPTGARSIPSGASSSPPVAGNPEAPVLSPPQQGTGDLNSDPSVPADTAIAPAIPQFPSLPGLSIPAIPGLDVPATTAKTNVPPKVQEKEATKPRKQCPCNGGLLSSIAQMFQGNAAALGNSARLGVMQGQLTSIQATTTANNAGIAANLTLLQTIQAFLQKAWAATHADKIINVLSLVGTLHNAAMLSRDVGETMGYVASNALAIVGIKDEQGNALDINGLVGSSVKTWIKNAVGADAYNTTVTFWQKSNRILTSASNVIWTLRSIHDSTQSVIEWSAENTGKIGNALKKYGVVGERSYPWMAERVKAQDVYRNKFSKFFDGLEGVEGAANSLSQVTSEGLNIVQEFQELSEARQRFNNAVQDLAPEATSTASPENKPIATEAADASAASQGAAVNIGVDGKRGLDDDTP